MTNLSDKTSSAILAEQPCLLSTQTTDTPMDYADDFARDQPPRRQQPDDGAVKRQVGMRLKESRKSAGFTQRQVAERMHMTQQQYSRFENGIFELNYWQLCILCKLFDISADFLFGLTDY